MSALRAMFCEIGDLVSEERKRVDKVSETRWEGCICMVHYHQPCLTYL